MTDSKLLHGHAPVLLKEVLECLQLNASSGSSASHSSSSSASHSYSSCANFNDNCSSNSKEIYLDGTYGRGGHAQAIWRCLAADSSIMVMDRDPLAIQSAAAWQAKVLPIEPQVLIKHATFDQAKIWTDTLGISGQISGILLDLGVSSPQLDDPARGFSFMQDGPLDMRMDPNAIISAETWLNTAEAKEIADVLYEYGDEKFSRRIAQKIIAARPLYTTQELVAAIISAIPYRDPNKHPATRSFLAIRMFINQELQQIQKALPELIAILKPGGKLAVISFHSNEDRIVKQFFARHTKGELHPPGLPFKTNIKTPPTLKYLVKMQRASNFEIEQNIRARSAILRAVEKLPCD